MRHKWHNSKLKQHIRIRDVLAMNDLINEKCINTIDAL